MSGLPVPSASPLPVTVASFDRRFVGHAMLWSLASLVAFGVVSAIIPSPIFGRQIAPEPFAIAVWLVSAPLMGLLGATYSSPIPPTQGTAGPEPLVGTGEAARAERDGSLVGAAASFGAFLAIGCPVCNKIALVLLGTGGAMTVFAPLQPIIGAASLAVLAGTLTWRMRRRVVGAACRR